MSDFIPIMDSGKLAARIREIQDALDKLASKTLSQVTISGTTYTQASANQLVNFRHATEREYHRAVAREGGRRTRIVLKG